MIINPRNVSLQESGQNAIIAWNGSEEIIILSTDIKSPKSSLILEVLPLPSNPIKVKKGNFNSFINLTKIINKKVRKIRKLSRSLNENIKAGEFGSFGVEITFHQKIGSHDITIVKVNNTNDFIKWINKFATSKGLKHVEITHPFKKTIDDYINRGINFFVFDVIETNKKIQSIEPIIYIFKTKFLYYPLEITATSDVGLSNSNVNIFLLTKGIINKTLIRRIGLWPVTGFEYRVKLNKKELKEISPEISSLFSSAYVMNVHYYGSLNRLNKDLIIIGKNYLVLYFILIPCRNSFYNIYPNKIN